MHGSPVEPDLVLYVQRHEKKSVRKEELTRKFKKQNLFVTNFGDNITEEILRDFFSQYGQIRNVKILTKKTEINGDVIESSKCKGFVCFENPEDARKVLDESKQSGIWFDSKRLNVSMFEPRSERTQTSGGKGTASGNPEIDNIIMQFLQTMSAGGLGAGFPMMNNPPMPPQPNRSNYGAKMPPQSRPPPANTGMYGRGPAPQPSFPGAGYSNMMGGPSGGMGMMPQPNYNQPKMMPTGPMPVAPTGMMQAAPMPPINVISEEKAYLQRYSELVNSMEYQSSEEDDKRNKIGDLIYSYVELKAGEVNAPKITGMIIDLELADLEASTSNLNQLQEKILEGIGLLHEEEEGEARE